METKYQALDRLADMYGCDTVVRTTDINGNNEDYSHVRVEDFFDADAVEYLYGAYWEYEGRRHATPENTDMYVWAQEMNGRCREALKSDLAENKLDIMTFRHDIYGTMEIVVW